MQMKSRKNKFKYLGTVVEEGHKDEEINIKMEIEWNNRTCVICDESIRSG